MVWRANALFFTSDCLRTRRSRAQLHQFRVHVQVQHAFWYISLLSLHDHDVKCFYVTFGGREFKLGRAVTYKLWDRIGVGLVKSLNQGLWLHTRIHFTPLHQWKDKGNRNTNITRNIYPDFIIKMLSGNKNINLFFHISAVCLGVCAYMHATFLLE